MLQLSRLISVMFIFYVTLFMLLLNCSVGIVSILGRIKGEEGEFVFFCVTWMYEPLFLLLIEAVIYKIIFVKRKKHSRKIANQINR
jgi:heme/copper-type cytochrome/quinol oxidase subunit 2